ncbi:hypothetical protein [Sulfobacillus harzensis]|uniref:MFS transporter n=1 Tax=Sulfobacillus harzensis TaxID=2729629 RepID=A0A7Y0Q4J7_9FIRM|nr:hypothetical protein [Sulfobacillus harzensis]NMP24091.1 MFS transporter [Sulfobacillus harzensis]
MFLASNFVGAWFWDIGTGLRPILLFYALLFVAMVTVFGLASKIRGRVSSPALMTLGIILNALYLALLLILKTKTREFFVPLAILDGLSSSFYWLSLFVLASSWVESGQASWYNSWTGTLEAILGLLAPPLSGWIIQALPGLTGYRTVFFIAFVALLACAWLILTAHHRIRAEDLPASQSVSTAIIPEWRRLGWSFWALGMRDGLYFFVPSLLLFIVTNNAVLLGTFSAMQAAIEGVVFWALTRWSHALSGDKGLFIATLVALTALGVIFLPLNAWVLFLLGAAIALSYPSFKVRLESAALDTIGRHSQNDADRMGLTGAKEVWINVGRLMSLGIVLLIVTLVGKQDLRALRWTLGLWSLVPVLLYLTARRLPQPQTTAQ